MRKLFAILVLLLALGIGSMPVPGMCRCIPSGNGERVLVDDIL